MKILYLIVWIKIYTLFSGVIFHIIFWKNIYFYLFEYYGKSTNPLLCVLPNRTLGTAIQFGHMYLYLLDHNTFRFS